MTAQFAGIFLAIAAAFALGVASTLGYIIISSRSMHLKKEKEFQDEVLPMLEKLFDQDDQELEEGEAIVHAAKIKRVKKEPKE
jgi:hypothetical protein